MCAVFLEQLATCALVCFNNLPASRNVRSLTFTYVSSWPGGVNITDTCRWYTWTFAVAMQARAEKEAKEKEVRAFKQLAEAFGPTHRT